MQLNAIKQMETFARYNPNVISLGQGIPFMHSDSSIRQDVIEAILQNKVDTYADPQGILELRIAISESLKNGKMDYSPNEILVTAGAMEALSVSLLTILQGDRNEVIIPTPTYSGYFKIVQVAKGIPIIIPLDERQNWRLDIAMVEKSITNKTAAILLCNPNNPTGSIYSRSDLLLLSVLAKKYNIHIILDEVYKNMIYDDNTFYSPCVVPEFKEHIIRVVSFSKDFSLTGWRVGFLQTSEDLIQKMLPVHDALINCVPVVSQYAALSALKHHERIHKTTTTIYNKHRTIMKSYLDSLNDFFSYTLPMGSYFFFPAFVKSQISQTFCMDLLKQQHVAVVPGSDFGQGGENHIRLCFGRSEKDIENAMNGLTRYIESVR